MKSVNKKTSTCESGRLSLRQFSARFFFHGRRIFHIHDLYFDGSQFNQKYLSSNRKILNCVTSVFDKRNFAQIDTSENRYEKYQVIINLLQQIMKYFVVVLNHICGSLYYYDFPSRQEISPKQLRFKKPSK